MMGIPNALRVGRRALRSLVGRDLFYRRELTVQRVSLGRPGAEWCVCPIGLGPASIVYSFGVGEDVSFEMELIERFGTPVHAFEPTPRSLAWVRSQGTSQGVHPPRARRGVVGRDGIVHPSTESAARVVQHGTRRSRRIGDQRTGAAARDDRRAARARPRPPVEDGHRRRGVHGPPRSPDEWITGGPTAR